jgi:hypothetical protein
MDAHKRIFRVVIDVLVGVSAAIIFFVPIWFLVAALGTQFGIWDYQFGLKQMTRLWGVRFLATGLVLIALTHVAIAAYSVWAKKLYGKFPQPVMGLLVVVLALGWTGHINGLRNAGEASLDVTTDATDPPGFSTSYHNRRRAEAGAHSIDLDRPGTGASMAWPGLKTLTLSDPPDAVYSRALAQARSEGWRIGAASRGAGMFEAGTSEFWFGFHDDMVIRIRDDGEGGSLVDMRSIAREPVHDLGRNAQRVEAFMVALEAG